VQIILGYLASHGNLRLLAGNANLPIGGFALEVP
jgi:hypothetical protein